MGMFKIFFALIGVLSLSLCDETTPSEGKPNLSEEKRQLSAEKSEDEETKIEPLTQIDEELKEELKNPTAPEASYEVQLKILKNLVNYYNRMVHLYNGVKNNTATKLQFAQNLISQDGPSFLKEDINTEQLKKVYNWDEENLQFFQDYMKDIRDVWNNITTCMHDKPTPMQIYFDKKLGM